MMHVALWTAGLETPPTDVSASSGKVTGFSTAQKYQSAILLKEASVEFRGIQRLLPRLMQLKKVAKSMLLMEC